MDQTMLIVEDAPAIAENIRLGLETEGFVTRWLTIGPEVLPLLSQTPAHPGQSCYFSSVWCFLRCFRYYGNTLTC